MISYLKKGFSIIELMVSISIVTAIMGVILFNYSSSNDSLALDSASQELAITVRQAQTYGLSVRESGVSTGTFTNAYGIYFSPTLEPSTYYLFIDKNSNNAYDHGTGCGTAGTECVESYSLRNNIRITSICDASQCAPAGSTKLNIVFRRPDPDAKIYFMNSSNAVVAGPSSEARVILSSPKTKTATISVKNTGQIFVQ